MALQNPPPQIAVIKWDSPNKTDKGLIELWNTEVAAYVPLDIGAPHPNAREYSGFKLGIQAPVEGNEKWVRRVFVTDNVDQDWFNYQLKYVEEAAGFPIYIRQYQELKSTYTERARLSPLQVVYKLRITNAGSGYDPSVKELPLTFSGGGATGRALINYDGTICQLVIDSAGSGYSVAPTFTIPAPSAGVTATGTAFIQSTGALLVKEDAMLYPEDSENYALYFNVLRIYQTLPGPWIFDGLFRQPGIEVDKESKALVIHKKRVNVPDNILASAIVYTGASGAITAVLSGQTVASGTISVAGTNYAEFVNLVFSASPMGRTAQGYAKTTAGAITSVIITDPGTGYNAGAPTVTVLPSAVVSTERKDIDANTSYEVVVTTTDSPYKDITTAKPEQKTIAYTFPGRIYVPSIMVYGKQGSFYNEPSAKDTIAIIKTFWVISQTPYTFAFDQIIYRGQITVNQNPGAWNGNSTTTPVATYNNVLWDANGQDIKALDGTVSLFFYPATTPSASQYTGLQAATGTITATNASAVLTGGGVGQIAIGDIIGGLTVTSLAPPTMDATWPYPTQNITLFVRPSAGWIGNYKNPEGSVDNEGSSFRFKVTVVQILME